MSVDHIYCELVMRSSTALTCIHSCRGAQMYIDVHTVIYMHMHAYIQAYT